MMNSIADADDEQSPLLQISSNGARRLSRLAQNIEAAAATQFHMTPDEQRQYDSLIVEGLAYNGYTTIDWLHDLARDSDRLRSIHNRKGIRNRLLNLFDAASGWIAAALIGGLTACVAFGVDIAEAVVSDWKLGYCSNNVLMDRAACCQAQRHLLSLPDFKTSAEYDVGCPAFHEWSNRYAVSFAVYVAFALAFGILSSSITMLTKRSLPVAISPEGHAYLSQCDQGYQTLNNNDDGKYHDGPEALFPSVVAVKSFYMSAGSGIPEIKTVLSGFEIPHLLSFRVLVAKAVGAVFAVATGMCLGKEGPFVHISACVGHLVSRVFPKYRNNGREMREMLSAACAAGLSVAFGAPIGGVLFSYEEISTHFPRKVLWRAFLCSLVASITLKALNPTGTGKLVLFETHYGTSYKPVHYLVFALLGVAGGIFGGLFCRANLWWSRWFRSFGLIKRFPVFEAALVVLVTALVQYPNPLAREPGDAILKNLLIDCRTVATSGLAEPDGPAAWVCEHEARAETPLRYVLVLLGGTLTKLVLTIVTFGVKVPSGVIIPALDGGAFFGRLVGQLVPTLSPGIFAMVGAAAFLAGVSRMTVSLCVIMFELTGELEYVVPHMVAVLIAKWTADALGREGVYDLAQAVLGHPFLDLDHATAVVQRQTRGSIKGEEEAATAADTVQEGPTVAELIPSTRTMEEITVKIPASNKVPCTLLETKLRQLKKRGLIDAGLVLVNEESMLQGYLAEDDLEHELQQLGMLCEPDMDVCLLGTAETGELDLSHIVNRTPLTISAAAPMEYAVEMFGKLGLKHLMVLEERTAKLVGVIEKKRMIAYLNYLKTD